MGVARFINAGWSRRRSLVGLMAALGIGLGSWVASSQGSARAATSARAPTNSPFPVATKASSGSECGKAVVTLPTQTQSGFKALPTSVKNRYNNWPFPVLNSPWTDHKKTKGPWKIGLISTPTGTPIDEDVIKEVQSEFAAYKKEGLVTGKLQLYVQPSLSTATAEQQIAAIQQMVRSGVNGILLKDFNAAAETPAVDAAGKAGVPVVIIDDVFPNSKYAINVFAERHSAPYAGVLKLLHGNGNVIYVRGIIGQTVELENYQLGLAAIKRCPGIHLVGTTPGDWSNAGAKSGLLSWFATHPTTKVDGVLNNDAEVAGIIEAFQQAGRKVPVLGHGGGEGGDLSWWAANVHNHSCCVTKSGAEGVGEAASGFMEGYTVWGVLMRVLNGNGPKVNSVAVQLPLITDANITTVGTPGKPLTWGGEPRGPVDGYATDSYLNQFFRVPGTPGRKCNKKAGAC